MQNFIPNPCAPKKIDANLGDLTWKKNENSLIGGSRRVQFNLYAHRVKISIAAAHASLIDMQCDCACDEQVA